MTSTLFLLAIGAALATFLGGTFALIRKDTAHLIVGFSAGAVIGVAFFDLLPEAFSLGGRLASMVVAIGFLAYLILDRTIGMCGHDHGHDHDHTRRSLLRVVSLCVHSFLDGLAIGFSFQVSAAVGSVVAVAVLAHDFSDGINTVGAMLKEGGAERAFRWLVLDALAPILGILATLFVSIPLPTLGIVLAIFAGFFLYIGASDLIPESYHAHPTRWTTAMTILGVAVMYAIIAVVK